MVTTTPLTLTPAEGLGVPKTTSSSAPEDGCAPCPSLGPEFQLPRSRVCPALSNSPNPHLHTGFPEKRFYLHPGCGLLCGPGGRRTRKTLHVTILDSTDATCFPVSLTLFPFAVTLAMRINKPTFSSCVCLE